MIQPAYSDIELFETTIELCKKFDIKKFIETGTFEGGSVLRVSSFFEEVISIEANTANYNKSIENTKHLQNVKLYHGNSPEILDKILKEKDDKIFFFLDAHWHHYWPLLDELSIIKNKCIKPVIAIHDFYVPNENGSAKFHYDSYNGQKLNWEYIKNKIADIYGVDGFIKKFNEKPNVLSGVIFIYPKD